MMTVADFSEVEMWEGILAWRSAIFYVSHFSADLRGGGEGTSDARTQPKISLFSCSFLKNNGLTPLMGAHLSEILDPPLRWHPPELWILRHQLRSDAFINFQSNYILEKNIIALFWMIKCKDTVHNVGIIYQNVSGDAGDRTRGLSHAKRTLYRWATSPCLTFQRGKTTSSETRSSFCIKIVGGGGRKVKKISRHQK